MYANLLFQFAMQLLFNILSSITLSRYHPTFFPAFSVKSLLMQRCERLSRGSVNLFKQPGHVLTQLFEGSNALCIALNVPGITAYS
jgi:hypothetical protein